MVVTQRTSEADQVYTIPRMAIVDDAEFDQMLYARIIGRTGLVGETLSFYTAEEALAYFEAPTAKPVDVILLDINMPGMSGFDFLDQVTSKRLMKFAEAVIVMLTTSLDPNDMARAGSYDLVKDYINKPLEEGHIGRISSVLEAVRKGAPTPL